MPYSTEHKRRTRAQIIEASRKLFNAHGFDGVSIDMIMKSVGLTRGGFYNHFKSKEALYGEAVDSFLMGRGAQWRDEAGVDPHNIRPEMANNMMMSYLSAEHLGDIEGQCHMIALPSDIARANGEVQLSYQKLLEAMSGLFQSALELKGTGGRKEALSLTALCIVGMVVARSLPDDALASEVRDAALTAGISLMG
jgi:AcrR family transcriptional regulator